MSAFANRMRTGARALALALLLAPHGCSSFSQAPAHRADELWYPEPIPEAWWPERRTEDLEEIAAAMPRVIREPSGVAGGPGPRVELVLPFGRGLILALRPADREGAGPRAGEPPELHFLSYLPDPRPAEELAAADSALVFVEPREREPRGLVVSLEGPCFPEDGEEVIDELLERGFAVLRVGVPCLVRQPLHLAIRGEEDLDGAALAAAAAIDDQLAERAYAVEAMLGFLAVRRPDLPLAPLVLMGCGLGAAAAPAVAARLDGAVDAAVLVGGGANLFEVSQEGEGVGGVETDAGWAGLSGKEQSWLSELYLAESRLDPYHTSRFLGRTPVLLFHARLDEVMPAWSGELLHRRLNQPDWIRVLGDHEDLLEEWVERAAWVADWIEEAVAR
ncbi:MAG: hypothetical protein HY812_12260 [Planctomycetes bacterium]|nr:hypothetical protein [Planctomycetota bacterium]